MAIAAWQGMKILLGLVILGAAVGCGRPRGGSQGARLIPVTAEAAAACPLGVDGASVTVADTDAGADVTITGAADHVDELRQRVHDAAQLHGAGSHEGLGHHGDHLGHQRHGLRLTSLPPIETSVEDVDGGALLHLVSIVPEQTALLRERLREQVALATRGPCD